MIELKNVHFTYLPANVVAIKGVSLSISKGEVVGVIGQNGSGKTTLVKLFNGLLRPTKGSVLINGKDVADKTVAQLSSIIGYVFQNPDDQIFSSSILEEARFGPKNLNFGKKRTSELVKDSLERVGLWVKRKKHPYDVGYNRRKLITIASIISMDPEVVIFDEPTTGQDAEGKVIVTDLINHLKKQKKTIIVISHDMEFIAESTDRVIVMDEGKVVADDRANKVFLKHKILRESFLNPPQITRFCQEVKELPDDLLTVEECVKAVKKLK